MYKDDLRLALARLQMSKEWGELGVPKVFPLMVRQKDSPNRAQVVACVVNLFNTDEFCQVSERNVQGLQI